MSLCVMDGRNHSVSSDSSSQSGLQQPGYRTLSAGHFAILDMEERSQGGREYTG